MFIDQTSRIRLNPRQLHYGIAVTDVDDDGQFELVVAGFGGNNQVLKWAGDRFEDIADDTLADAGRRAIGVAAGDINRDGREEIYVLNTDTFAGRKRHGDRLFLNRGSKWIDLFEMEDNQAALNMTAGRSVGVVDRFGNGNYGFFVVNYGGPMRYYELGDDGIMVDVARTVGVGLVTGGRAFLSLPLISQHMDVFCGNENGMNFLFVNQGNGTFSEVAEGYGLEDPAQHVRGAAVVDANDDGRLDLVYGSWEGYHRLFVREADERFQNVASPDMAYPSRIRTVIAADFDNDGYEEIFFNNIGQSNRLFAWRDGDWQSIDIGDAAEPDGLGTGAAIGDFDADGRLELLIAHGESGAQPLSLYYPAENDNHYCRVLPLTRYGAPARGAIVTLYANGRRQIRAIDAGSGYLCQMEPVAHFGLGAHDVIDAITVRWPGGAEVTVESPEPDRLLRVEFPGA